jgi:hypothetical protein
MQQTSCPILVFTRAVLLRLDIKGALVLGYRQWPLTPTVGDAGTYGWGQRPGESS